MSFSDPDVEQVIQLETKALTSEGRHDPEFLGRILADGYVECGASGRMVTKSDVIRELGREAGTTFRIVGEIKPEKVSDDVITTMFTITREEKGEKVTSRRFSLWRRADGTWRIYYHQGTPTSLEQ